MKIYLDNIKISDQIAGGVSMYWCEIIRRLLRSNNEVTFIENIRLASNNIFRKSIEIPADRILNENYLPHKMLRYLPILNLNGSGIFHSSYYRLPYNSGLKTIVTVYDFVYERYRTGLPRFIHHNQKKNAILKADGIICISESTKSDLLEIFPSASNKLIRVISLAATDDFYRITTTDKPHLLNYEMLQSDFILFVGDRSGYKNFNIAVEAISTLPEFTLVFVGGGELKPYELRLLNAKLYHRYFHLGSVDNTILNLLYNNAFCMLYPSSYEGFGIPLLEAMKAGCVVVSSNVSSIPEVCGDAALLANAITADEFADKILKLKDSSLLDALRNKGFERTKLFSWDKTYNETVEFYRELS